MRLSEQLAGTTAWRPTELEPITEIHSSKPIMVFSDIHAPIHSIEWIGKGIQMAKKLDARILICNGDFIDANTISRHLGGYYRRKNELEDDLAAGEALTKIFAQEFEKVFFLCGNHDLQRLLNVFKGEVKGERLWKMFGSHDNVKLTSRSYVHVNKDVLVGHPRQYSSVRGSLAIKIAAAKHKHVILGHEHHAALTISKCGQYQACAVGCMADLEAFEYVKNEVNDFAEPLNGFAVVCGTKIMNFNKFTPWELFDANF